MLFKRMYCNKIRKELPGFLSDEIKGREKEQINAHLEECVQCREELTVFAKQNNILLKQENIEPSLNFRNELLEKINEYERLKQINQEGIKRMHLKWFLPVPAIGVIVFFIIFAFTLLMPFAYGIPLENKQESLNFVIGSFSNLHQKSILAPINLINYCNNCCRILCKCYQSKTHKGCICGGCENDNKN